MSAPKLTFVQRELLWLAVVIVVSFLTIGLGVAVSDRAALEATHADE